MWVQLLPAVVVVGSPSTALLAGDSNAVLLWLVDLAKARSEKNTIHEMNFLWEDQKKK